jgi:hypothetical protein
MDNVTTDAHPDDPVAWDVDALDGDELRRAYDDLATFVAWLHDCDITVPACWYTHGWVVRRLAALSYWQEASLAPESHPRDAADWWLVGVEPLRRDWADLIAHRGRHVPAESPIDNPAPIPGFEEFVDALVTERRR